jgi:hypothetical protein
VKPDQYQASDERLVRAVNDIVLWSEEGANLYGEAEESAVVERAQQLAVETGAYIGVTYEYKDTPQASTAINILTLVEPSGNTAFR